jgi:hypothetical protein
MKTIAAFLIIATVLASGIMSAGCTTMDTYNTATPIPSSIPLGGDDRSAYLTAAFGKTYDIVTPFSKSKNSAGDVIYSGVVIDKKDSS